jgi:transposase InsO family protein
MKVSERRICRVLGQHRSTQRYQPHSREDEDRLVADMIELARQYGGYGYRRVTALLRDAGWQVSVGRVERLWKREGLKVPAKQPKKGRLWLNDGSCIRLRPERRNHVWSYDFVHCRTDDGKVFRTLNRDAQIIIEGWRKHYNTKRPHSALGYRPPAPETVVQMDPRPVMH